MGDHIWQGKAIEWSNLIGRMFFWLKKIKIYFLNEKKDQKMEMIKYKYILPNTNILSWNDKILTSQIFFSLNLGRFGLNMKAFNKQK